MRKFPPPSTQISAWALDSGEIETRTVSEVTDAEGGMETEGGVVRFRLMSDVVG